MEERRGPQCQGWTVVRLILNNASTLKGGSEQVALSFIGECQKFSENVYHVVICGNLAAQIDQQQYPNNIIFHVLDKRPAGSLINFYHTMHWFERLALRVQPDCVVATGGHGYWRPARIPVLAGFNMPHYVYPESPFLKSQPFKKWIYWSIRKHIDFHCYNRVDALFVQTDDVKRRLASKLKVNRIYTVSNTLHPAFFDARGSSAEDLLPERGDRIRLLTVSAYYPHKNLEVIPKVLDRLRACGRNDIVFVLTLKNDDFQRVVPSQYHNSVLNVGPLPIAKVPGLYHECDFMFLPTLLECFSASYAEAMAMGKPIITSDMGFAHTVCKDAALYFDPMNPSDIAEKIILLASAPDLRAQLVVRGRKLMKTFGNSEDRAREILRICKEMVKNSKKAR